MIEKTEAVILHTGRFRDSGAIISLYTRVHGKVRLVAKGARRLKGGYGSAVMPLSIAEVSYMMREGRDLHTLRTAETTQVLKTLSGSYDRLMAALAIAELVDLTQPLHERNEKLFEALVEALRTLDASKKNFYSTFVAFCVRCAEAMGFGMSVEEAETLTRTGDAMFSLEDGRMVEALPYAQSRAIRISSATMRKIAELARDGISRAGEVEMSAAEQKEAQEFFVRYFSHHVDRSIVLRTEKMLLGTTEGSGR